MTFATDGKLGVDFTSDSATPLYRVGTTCQGSDGTIWMYIQFTAVAVTQYQFIAVSELYVGAALTSALADYGYKIGVAQSAFTASYYGWVAMSGTAIYGNVISGATSGSKLFAGTVGGQLNITSTLGTYIQGVSNVTATTTAATSPQLISSFTQVGVR